MTDERGPFWDYQDLALFAGIAIPSLVVSFVLLKLASPLTARLAWPKDLTGLVFQFVWYAILFFGLKLLLQLRYGRPFWRSLGWKGPDRAALIAFAAGPVLALATGLIGNLMRAPKIQLTPLKGLLATRASVALLIVFVGFLGPLFEELAFRGFLMPLLVRSLGAVSGIVFTALLFALLHGPEYEWSWRHVTLILLAGVVFGSVRYVTRSTTAAVMIHSSYNLTFLIAFISQSGAIPAQW